MNSFFLVILCIYIFFLTKRFVYTPVQYSLLVLSETSSSSLEDKVFTLGSVYFISSRISQDGVDHQDELQKNITYCNQGGQVFALKVVLPHFWHNFLGFIRLLWATDSAYQHQAVIQRNSIIPHLLPAVTEEEIALPGCHQPGRREELWVRTKKEKKTVTPQNPPKSRKDGSHTNFKSQADLFLTAIQNY